MMILLLYLVSVLDILMDSKLLFPQQDDSFVSKSKYACTFYNNNYYYPPHIDTVGVHTKVNNAPRKEYIEE